jgi:hypothetical protein
MLHIAAFNKARSLLGSQQNRLGNVSQHYLPCWDTFTISATVDIFETENAKLWVHSDSYLPL